MTHTLTTVRDYDPEPWNKVVDSCRDDRDAFNETAQGLRDDADDLAESWQGDGDELDAMQQELIDEALAYEELAVHHDNIAGILVVAVNRIEQAQSKLTETEAWIDSLAHLYIADDHGTVEHDYDPGWFVLPEETAYLWDRTSKCNQATSRLQETILIVEDVDRATALALDMSNVELPDPGDGPLDLSDQGLAFMAQANSQGAYGSCVTLSILQSVMANDPQFIRDHVKWNPDTEKYEITLYRDGEKVVQEVDPENIAKGGSSIPGSKAPTVQSLYEQAIQQEFGDIDKPKLTSWVDQRILGPSADTKWLTPPPSIDRMRDALNQEPPAIITAGTTPWNLTGADVAPSHNYTITKIDDDGNVTLQNPWGIDGGFSGKDGRYRPGVVTMSADEFNLSSGYRAITTY